MANNKNSRRSEDQSGINHDTTKHYCKLADRKEKEATKSQNTNFFLEKKLPKSLR